MPLLLACYGPRFGVSLRTQVETAKKELREGFDVLVFGAGQWPVEKCHHAERRREDLDQRISDARHRPVSGARLRAPLRDALLRRSRRAASTPERKRMFMQMKREASARIPGGYRREIFVSADARAHADGGRGHRSGIM
ncbi:MAG: hypothetical protein MZW92_68025 [Comamonadaceae bacterium]|nr:hypothetical protein [Comamonadaceae bacterium]